MAGQRGQSAASRQMGRQAGPHIDCPLVLLSPPPSCPPTSPDAAQAPYVSLTSSIQKAGQ